MRTNRDNYLILGVDHPISRLNYPIPRNNQWILKRNCTVFTEPPNPQILRYNFMNSRSVDSCSRISVPKHHILHTLIKSDRSESSDAQTCLKYSSAIPLPNPQVQSPDPRGEVPNHPSLFPSTVSTQPFSLTLPSLLSSLLFLTTP